MLYWPLILGGVAFLGATSMLVVSIITRSPAVAPTPEEIEEDAVTGPPYVRPASEEETTDGVEEISLKIDSSHSGPQSPASEPTPPLTPYEAFVALDLGHAEPPATSCCARLGIDLNLIAGGLRSAASSIADRLPTFSCHRPANPQNLALRLARMAGITITEAAALISFIYLMEEGTSIANNENYPVINLPQYFLSFFYGFLAQDFISLLPGNIKQICYKILHQYNAVEFMLIILASRIAEEAVPGTSFIFDIYAIARLAMIVRHRVGEEYENLLQKIRGTRSNTSDSVVTDKTTNPPAPDRKKIPLELYTSKPGPVVAYSALVFSSLTTWALFSYLSPTCVFGEATDTQERSILSLLPNDLPTLILTALLGGLTYTEACKKIRNGELDFIARIAPFATLLLRPGYSWINLALIFSGGVVGSVAIHATIHDDQIAQHCRTSQTQTIARALSSFNLESLKDLQNQALEYVGQNQTSARSNYKKMIYILHVLAIIDAIFLAINAISSDDPNGLTNVLMQLLTDSILYGSALATTVVAENSFSEVKNTIGNRLIHAWRWLIKHPLIPTMLTVYSGNIIDMIKAEQSTPNVNGINIETLLPQIATNIGFAILMVMNTRSASPNEAPPYLSENTLAEIKEASQLGQPVNLALTTGEVVSLHDMTKKMINRRSTGYSVKIVSDTSDLTDLKFPNAKAWGHDNVAIAAVNNGRGFVIYYKTHDKVQQFTVGEMGEHHITTDTAHIPEPLEEPTADKLLAQTLEPPKDHNLRRACTLFSHRCPTPRNTEPEIYRVLLPNGSKLPVAIFLEDGIPCWQYLTENTEETDPREPHYDTPFKLLITKTGHSASVKRNTGSNVTKRLTRQVGFFKDKTFIIANRQLIMPTEEKPDLVSACLQALRSTRASTTLPVKPTEATICANLGIVIHIIKTTNTNSYLSFDHSDSLEYFITKEGKQTTYHPECRLEIEPVMIHLLQMDSPTGSCYLPLELIPENPLTLTLNPQTPLPDYSSPYSGGIAAITIGLRAANALRAV